MSHLDDELREALRRQQPPAGFTQRVLARVAERQRSRWKTLLAAFRMPRLRWAAAAAVVVAMVAGFQFQRQRQIRAQGELAKEQVVLALRITASELQVARQKVREVISVR